MIKDLVLEIEKLKEQLNSLEDDKKTIKEDIEDYKKDIETGRLRLIDDILELFVGIKPTVKLDECGIEIRIKDSSNELFVLDYLYNDTSFEIIDRELACKIVDMYNETYGIPKEKQEYQGYTVTYTYNSFPNFGITQFSTNK
jgi:hypothetical protein